MGNFLTKVVTFCRAPTMETDDFLAACFSQLMHIDVVPKSQISNPNYISFLSGKPLKQMSQSSIPLSINILLQRCLERSPCGDQPEIVKPKIKKIFQGPDYDPNKLLVYLIPVFGEYFHLNISPSQSVNQLKCSIRDITGTPCSMQQLRYGHKIMENDDYLCSDYAVEVGTDIELLGLNEEVDPNRKCIFVQLNERYGKIINFEFDSSVNVDHLKLLIQDAMKIPVDKQQLYFQGKTLDTSHCRLLDIGVPLKGKVLLCIGKKFELIVKTLTGESKSFECFGGMYIADLKKMIEISEGIPIDKHRLVFAGKQLEDGRMLLTYNILKESTVHMVLRLPGGGCDLYSFDDDVLSPKYNYDLTNEEANGRIYYRGNEIYSRPYGWKRIAIKVLDHFEENVWLGVDGIRCESSEDEWPVSYHGTGIHNKNRIGEHGYLLSIGKMFRFWSGFYTTPDIKIAELFSETFDWKGRTYKVVLQNRVNPTNLQKIDLSDGGQYWVSQNDNDVRTYGILIKEAN